MAVLNSVRAIRFRDAAFKHLEAAHVLLAACPPNSESHLASEVVYLGGYVVECLLKSLLFASVRPRRHKMLEREVVSDIGHNIEKLRARLESLRKPVRFPDHQLRYLRRVRSNWRSEMRYGNRLVATATAIGVCHSVVAIVDWVKERLK